MAFLIRLADPEVGAGHEGNVLGDVGEDAELGAGRPVAVGGEFGGAPDGLPQQQDRVHVDAGAGRCHVDRGADPFGGGKRLRDRCNQGTVAAGQALFHERREPADEIHVDLPCRRIQGAGDLHQVRRRQRRADHGDGADGDALVDHGDPVLLAHALADRHQLARQAHHALGDPPPHVVQVGTGAVQQVDPQRHRAHIQVLVFEHFQGGEDFSVGQHGSALLICGEGSRKCCGAGC